MRLPNYSRRAFLLNSVSSLTATIAWLASPGAWSAKHKKGLPEPAGPHALARQEWPPAIVPDHIGVDRGYCSFTDEFGRLAVVDMRKPGDLRTPPHVVAELNGLGKKVLDFKIGTGRGYGVVVRGPEGGDTQLVLICVSLMPVNEPAIIADLVLDRFVEVTSMSVNGELICIGGTTISGENMVAVYAAQRHGRQSELSLLSNWTATTPIIALDLQDRNLAVLETSNLEYVSLVDPRTPQTKGAVKLDGDYKTMTRFRDLALVIGTASGEGDGKQPGRCSAQSIALEPAPHAVSQLALSPLTNVFDACAQKDHFLVLGEENGERCLMSLSFDKTRQVHKGEIARLPRQNVGYGARSSIVASNKTAYIASGWAGIEIVANTGGSWSEVCNYSIPRLPASGIAAWGNKVVIAGSDLKLYDIAVPGKPVLVSTSSINNPARAIVGAGSYVLCLTKDSVNLRHMDNLDQTITACKLTGQQICYDPLGKKGYVLNEAGKKTMLIRLKVYSNEVAIENNYELPGTFTRASSLNSAIAVAGLNDISLYSLGNTADLSGSRHFENLAIRDIALRENDIVASAVDQKSKGFLLVLSRGEKDLRILGSVDLPHDGAALSVDKSKVVAIGKAVDGKDTAVVVDISNTATPRVLAKIDAVEGASAVVIKDQIAIVAGRGIEILSLS